MAPFQHVSVTLGQTADLGFSFRTEDESGGEGRHVVDYSVNGDSDPHGLREGDLIVGINHKPLPNANVLPLGQKRETLTHDELVWKSALTLLHE